MAANDKEKRQSTADTKNPIAGRIAASVAKDETAAMAAALGLAFGSHGRRSRPA